MFISKMFVYKVYACSISVYVCWVAISQKNKFNDISNEKKPEDL